MKVIVVGSSSFVGENIISTLKTCLFEIVGLQRRPASNRTDYKVISWNLGQQIPAELLATCDWIIFCAHDVKNSDNNTTGYQILLNQIEQFPQLKSIYVSSFSAFENAPSAYGRIKYSLETEFIKRNSFVVRPGLVIGRGGLFQDLYRSILNYPIVPIIGFQDTPISYVDVLDLSLFIKEIMGKNPDKKEFNVFNKDLTTQVQLAHAIKKSAKKTFLFLS